MPEPCGKEGRNRVYDLIKVEAWVKTNPLDNVSQTYTDKMVSKTIDLNQSRLFLSGRFDTPVKRTNYSHALDAAINSNRATKTVRINQELAL